MLPYRIAAPPEPEPPAPEEAYAAMLRREARRSLVTGAAGAAAVALAVAGIAASVGAPASASTAERLQAVRAQELGRRDAARDAVENARARAVAEQARFEQSVRAAVGDGAAPSPELGACPIALPRPSGSLRGRAFPMIVSRGLGLASSLRSQAVADVLSDVGRAERHLAAGRYEEATLYARALEARDRYGYEVVVVASRFDEPRATGPTSYAPGEITGRAYLYDFGTKTVRCAADVTATSSNEIGYAYAVATEAPLSSGREASLAASIDEDMRRKLEGAIADAMRWRAAAAPVKPQ